MHGKPSYRGSTSSLTFEGVHSITNAFSIEDSNHNTLFTVQPTSVTCSVDFNDLSSDVCSYLKNVTSDVQDQLDTCLKVQESTLHLTEDLTITGSYTHNNVTTPYKFAGVTLDELHCLSGVHTNIQHQFDTINTVNDTAFKVIDDMIELIEDITLEGYDENGDAYTFAGATPAEITRLNGVTHPIQTQLDEVITELDALNMELDLCIKMGENKLS